MHRWQKVLRPGLVKGPWQPEEDAKVRELVQIHGLKKSDTTQIQRAKRELDRSHVICKDSQLGALQMKQRMLKLGRFLSCSSRNGTDCVEANVDC
jgi:hypothetical protein